MHLPVEISAPCFQLSLIHSTKLLWNFTYMYRYMYIIIDAPSPNALPVYPRYVQHNSVLLKTHIHVHVIRAEGKSAGFVCLPASVSGVGVRIGVFAFIFLHKPELIKLTVL